MAIDLNTFQTTMGWNQLIRIDYSDATALFDANGVFTIPSGGTQVLRVESYDIGIRQTGEAPDYVTGRTDRTAWRKGAIISEGALSYPFTIPSSGTEASGLSLFLAAAELVKVPSSSFSIESSAHPKISGCKVANSSVSCKAEGPVTANSTVWGIVDQDALAEVHSYGDPRRHVWGPGTSSTTQADPVAGTIIVSPFTDYINADGLPGAGSGADVGGLLALEQIPMFDVCSVEGTPVGMFVVGFSIEINNALLRNYTMGSGSDDSNQSQYSPYGLNATNISANQRRITGTITWQSDYEGHISQILGVGIESLIIRIGNVKFTLNQVMWNATPPTLGAGERVTVESSFTAMGTGKEDGNDAFDALIIELNDILPPGL